jgi:hypothetical protein
MHLHHPSLSLNGKKKGKVKWASAEQKRQAEALAQDWADVKSRWGVEEDNRRRRRAMSAETLTYTLTAPPGRSTSSHIPSRDTGHSGAVKSRDIPKYTGTKMLGVSQMAKSNAVPVFNTDHIIEITKMRRG